MKTFNLAPYILFALFLLAVPCAFAMDVNEALKKAEELVNSEIDKQTAPELIAMQLNLKYPPQKPEMQLIDIFKHAVSTANQELEKAGLAKRDEEIFLEISRKYSLIKVGDKITVVTKLRYNNEVSGRYHGINRQRQVKIGSRWVRMQDLDDDTVARLDETLCDELIKKKFAQAKHKQSMEAATFRKNKTKEIALKLLKENGYMPKMQDDSSPDTYMNMANWQTSEEYLKHKIEKRRNFLRKKIEGGIIEKFMTEHGFQYDEIREGWFKPEKENKKNKEINNTKETKTEKNIQASGKGNNNFKKIITNIKNIF